MDPEERPSSITLWQEIAAGKADPPPVHSETPPASLVDQDGNDGDVSSTQAIAADDLETDQLDDTVDTRPELIDLDETVEIDMRATPIKRAETEPVDEQPASPADPDANRDVNRIKPAVYPDTTRSPLSGAMPSSRRGISIALVALSLLLFVSGALVVWFGFPIYERKFKTDWVVDASGGGDTTTISEAVRRAGRGATIRVAPGTYPETVVLERALNLRAPSNGQRPVIAPPSGPCLVTSAGFGSVSGFIMRVTTDQPNEACVIVAKGRMQLNDNEISGGAGAAILVRDGAAPILRGNRVSDTDGPGLVVATGAAGFIERNSFIEIGSASILVRGGGAPRISENIVDNGGGVIFAEGAKGWLLNNRISNPSGTGVQVLSGAAPQIFDNAVENAAEAGIFIYDFGRGVVQNNTIKDSGLSGIVIASGAAPRITGNEIIGSGEHGILIVGTSGATIRDNTIRNSRGHAIAIAADADAEIGDNVMSENREPQVLDDRNR
jgi:parallel beta-helix repeat protein